MSTTRRDFIKSSAVAAAAAAAEITIPGLTRRGKAFWENAKCGWGTLAPGAPADVTVFDPKPNWAVKPERFESKCRFTPFAGWKAKGRAALTLVGGQIKFRAR